MELTPPLPDAVLAQLVVELADAVVVADTAGTIRFWNGAAERVFGWTADEALGASLDLIVPERQRTRHWEGYRRAMSSGTTKYGSDLLRVPSLHADGQRHSIAFTVTLLKDADGTVTGIAAVARDETERWNQEQELRRLAHAAAHATKAATTHRPPRSSGLTP
jgi:PAS domain S-box-containing protein